MNANTPSSHLSASYGFYRCKQIIQLLGISRSSWWAGVKAGKFPAGKKLGPRTTVWLRAEIHELIDRVGRNEA